jgi:hypothetical protein
MIAIDSDLKRWRPISVELTPGAATWNIFVDSESIPMCDGGDPAKEFMSIVSNIIKYSGGGIPRIVENNLSDEDWQSELNEAAEKSLDDSSLAKLADTLKDVPIYITGDRKLASPEPNVEGKIIWTLSSEQFLPHCNAPDLSKARLLIFVENLKEVKVQSIVYRSLRDEDIRGSASQVILGLARVVVHETVHALRWRWVFLNKVFVWIRMNGDWNISMQQMKSDAATPEKLMGYCYHTKATGEFRADSGRLWENSVTRGEAVFEGNFCLIGVAVGRHAAREEVYSERLSAKDAIIVMEDPSKLVTICRRYAERLTIQCRQGYNLQAYVSCSHVLRR